MPLNEDAALAQRERIKQAYPDVHVDIQAYKPAGEIICTDCTLWTWRTGDARAIPLRSEVEIEQWFHLQDVKENTYAD